MKDEENLKKLIRICKKNNITVDDLKKYQKKVISTLDSKYLQSEGMKSIRCFLRFCKARGYKCLNPDCVGDYDIDLKLAKEKDIVLNMKNKPGRPPKVALISKAKHLRKEGLSYRAIGEKMNRDVSQVYVWCNAQEFKWVR